MQPKTRSNPPEFSFSVVVPSYNQVQFLERCVRSILDQENVSVECIVMDGGSTDGSKNILERLSNEYGAKLIWQSQKDNGQADAINQGLAKARGHFLSYLNSDDEYQPGALEKVQNAFTQFPETTWITGDCEIINTVGNEIQPLIRLYKRVLRRFLCLPLLAVVNPIAQPATFWRKEVFKTVNNFDESIHFCLDYDYWFRVWRHFGRPLCLPHSLAKFRIHQASKGGSQYQRQFQEERIVSKKYVPNKMLFFLHRVHVFLTVRVYNLIKK